MARSLKFGRLPAKAPDLTATIMGMIREYEGARDRNIVSAWNDGGDFEGKPVTDERLMDHFDQRIADTEPGDPMYDYWKETKWQYQFNIAEQKVSLSYAQGKMSTNGVARFYKTWAGKVPKHSAAYRDMMLSATKFGQATRTGANSSGAASHASSVSDQITSIYESDVQPSMQARDYLNEVAALVGWNPVESMNLTEAAAFDELLTMTAETNPDVYDRMKRGMRNAGLGGGPLTVEDVIRGMDKAKAGYRRVIALKRKEGWSTTADEAEVAKLKAGKKTLVTITRDIPNRYEAITRELAEDLAAAAGDPFAEVEARQEASAALLELSGKTPDSLTSGSLYAQSQALLGKKGHGTTLSEDYTQTTQGKAGGRAVIDPEDAQKTDLSNETSEMESQSASALKSIRAVEGLADGTLVQVYNEFDKTNPWTYVDPSTMGPHESKVVPGKTVTIVDENGKTRTVKVPAYTVAAEPVKNGAVMVKTDLYGNTLDEAQSKSATNVVYSVSFGPGQTVWITQTKNPDGTTSKSYSTHSPLIAGADGKPLERFAVPNAAGTGWEYLIRIDPDQMSKRTNSSTYRDPVTGQVIFDPTKVDHPPLDDFLASHPDAVLDESAIDMDPNALLDPHQRGIQDALGIGTSTQGASAASEATYKRDAEGKVVPGTRSTYQEPEEVEKNDPWGWMPDTYEGQVAAIERGKDESKEAFFRRVAAMPEFNPTPGLGGAAVDDGLTPEQRTINQFRQKGGGPANDWVPPPPAQPRAEGEQPVAPPGLTGEQTDTTILDLVRGDDPAAIAFAVSNTVKQPDLTEVLKWSTIATATAATDIESAKRYAAMDRNSVWDEAMKDKAFANDLNKQRDFMLESDSLDQMVRADDPQAFQSGIARFKSPIFNSFLGGAIRDSFETPQQRAARLGYTTAEQLAETGRLGSVAKTVFGIEQFKDRSEAQRAERMRDNDGNENGPSLPGVGVPGLPGTVGVGAGLQNAFAASGTIPPVGSRGGMPGSAFLNPFDPHRNDYVPRGAPGAEVRSQIGPSVKPYVVPESRPDVKSHIAQRPEVKVPTLKTPKPPAPPKPPKAPVYHAPGFGDKDVRHVGGVTTPYVPGDRPGEI